MEATAEGGQDKLRRPMVLHVVTRWRSPCPFFMCLFSWRQRWIGKSSISQKSLIYVRPTWISPNDFPIFRNVDPFCPCIHAAAAVKIKASCYWPIFRVGSVSRVGEGAHNKRPCFFSLYVAGHQLTPEEGARRCSRAFRPAFDAIDHDSTVTSFLRDKYQLFFGDLIERLKVDMTILDFNYTRLNTYMRLFMDEQMRLFKLRPSDVQLIHESEYPLALEFFLQFDGRAPHLTMGSSHSRRCLLVNLFYLKTCSFRFARPRTMSEGLFCAQEPEARYELASCGNCGLCHPQYDRSHRTNKSVVEFSEAHQHTFLNGYRAILNCSAVSPLASAISCSPPRRRSRAIPRTSSMH